MTTTSVPLQTGREGLSFIAEQMTRWVEQVLGPDFRRYQGQHAWSPAVNLYEDGQAFYLVADIAGMRPEDIDLRVEAGKILVRGERPHPCPQACEFVRRYGPAAHVRAHMMEIDNGPFLRALELPESVDGGGIEASYHGGFLWVRMPKKR